jgi:hypothetical protein
MKMAGTGATFPSTPGAQRVLETSLTVVFMKTYCLATWNKKLAKVYQ